MHYIQGSKPKTIHHSCSSCFWFLHTILLKFLQNNFFIFYGGKDKKGAVGGVMDERALLQLGGSGFDLRESTCKKLITACLESQ